jgi:predicted nucleotidyltransferase
MHNDFNHGLSENDIDIIRNILKIYPNHIDKVGIFGSRATGTYKPYSDIDMVLYGTLTQEQSNHIQTLFIDSPLIYKVDILTYNDIDYIPLKEHIDKCVKELVL